MNVITGKNDPQGFLPDGYIGAARFVDFAKKMVELLTAVWTLLSLARVCLG
nr:hypothetical protein [Pantoea allii]